MGQLGIPVWCYEWVAVLNWVRADKAFVSRGGALVTGYDHRKMIGRLLQNMEVLLRMNYGIA